jgi:hypothetical protein
LLPQESAPNPKYLLPNALLRPYLRYRPNEVTDEATSGEGNANIAAFFLPNRKYPILKDFLNFL